MMVRDPASTMNEKAWAHSLMESAVSLTPREVVVVEVVVLLNEVAGNSLMSLHQHMR
jgi:hypothetical protein